MPSRNARSDGKLGSQNWPIHLAFISAISSSMMSLRRPGLPRLET